MCVFVESEFVVRLYARFFFFSSLVITHLLLRLLFFFKAVLVDFLVIRIFTHNVLLLFRPSIGPALCPFLQTKPQGPDFYEHFHSPSALKQSEQR